MMKTKILLVVILLGTLCVSGQMTWQKTYGRTDSLFCRAHSVEQTKDNGYILVGMNGTNDAFLVRTNVLGDTLWTRVCSNIFPIAVSQAFDSGFVIVG